MHTFKIKIRDDTKISLKFKNKDEKLKKRITSLKSPGQVRAELLYFISIFLGHNIQC